MTPPTLRKHGSTIIIIIGMVSLNGVVRVGVGRGVKKETKDKL